MSTKLVTTFFAAHDGPPFWGKRSRFEWYAYSIISICNLGAEVVCYTDAGDKGFDYLNEIKIKHNLTNLTIKLFDLTTSPFHDRIYRNRMNNPELYNNGFHPFYTLPIAIYWLKWHFLDLEYDETKHVYWIDAGLSTGSLFPYALCKYKDEEGFATRYNHDREQEYKHFIFTGAFNPQTMDKINTFVEDKILCTCRQDVMDNDYRKLGNNINEDFYDDIVRSNKFPVGAMFGGKTPYLKNYITAFTELANKILELPEQNYACTEQELMGYIHIKYPEWFKDWCFNTFYQEESTIWNDLLIHDPNLKSFYRFFTDPLK
jgi:hypothetical protein